MCCAIKPIAAWHIEQVATTTRERCGGQVRYLLSYSKLLKTEYYIVRVTYRATGSELSSASLTRP
jgi:hypothetical protein